MHKAVKHCISILNMQSVILCIKDVSGGSHSCSSSISVSSVDPELVPREVVAEEGLASSSNVFGRGRGAA